MSDKKSRLILSILMLISVLTVIAASLGWLGQDTTAQILNPDRYGQGANDTKQTGNQQAPDSSDSLASDSNASESLRPLAIDLTQPAFESETRMRPLASRILD